MTFAAWLKRFPWVLPRSRKPDRASHPRRPSCKLQVEALETRLTPATTWTVTSPDGGNNVPGSLRYIVDNQVANGDTIVFGISGTINLKGAISIGHSITIDGSGSDITVDGHSSGNVYFRCVNINTNGGVHTTVTIKDLTITDGNGINGLGGDIAVNSGNTLNLIGDTITDSIGGTQTGGGIYNAGTLTAADCTIADNSASNGGGIYDLGTASLINDTITGNTGDGIETANSGHVSIYNTLVAGNTGTDLYESNGAPISSGGGNLYGTAFQFNPLITGNYPDIQSSSPNLGSLQANGGDTATIAPLSGSPALGAGNPAPNTPTAAGTATVSANQVAAVTMTKPGAFYTSAPTVVFTGGSGYGAAGTATISGGVITGVTVTDGGTGYTSAPTVNFVGGTFSYTDQRGFARVVGGRIDIGAFENQSQFYTLTPPGSNPNASAGTAATFNLGSFSEPIGSSWGASVSWGDATTTTFAASSQGTLPTQTHTYYVPGSYTVTVTLTDNYGDFSSMTFGVTVSGSITVTTLNDTDASNASASPLDGSGDISLRSALEYANANNYAGTVAFTKGLSGTLGLTIGNLQITDSNNLTIAGSGATITVSGAGLNGVAQGGVFAVTTSATDVIDSLTIANGHALTGGGVYSSAGSLTLSNDTIRNNTAGSASSSQGRGGGIYSQSGATLALTDDLIDDNAAASNGVNPYSASGGGIYNKGTLNVRDTTVEHNTASTSGGGIFNDHGTATLTNTTVANNMAADAGGGIYNYGGRLTLTSSTVANNTATGYFGGGISTSGGNLTLANDTIASNTSGKAAGGLSNFNCGVTILDTIVDGNTALNAPADLQNLSGSVTSSGGNLYGSASGTISWQISDIHDAGDNPGLVPLQNNGGPTQTLAVLPGSLASQAGQTTGVTVNTDQRGFTRIVNGNIDSGAFQNQSQWFGLTAPANVTVDAGQAASISLGSFTYSGSAGYTRTVTVSWGDGTQTVFTTTSQGSLTPQSHTYTVSNDYTVSVYVSDGDNNFAQMTFSVTVNPAVTVSPSSVPTGAAGGNYAGVTFTAGGGSGGGYGYSASGSLDGLTFSGGALGGMPLAPGTFNFTVTATDGIGGTGSQSYTLIVYPALTILPGSGLPTGTVGDAYGQQINASGGSGGYSFSTASALPAGLSLSSTGLLAGTPTGVFATATVTVQVTDSAGDTATQDYSLVVNPAIAIGPPSVPEGIVGGSYAGATFMASGGSGGGYTYSASGSLDGLTFSGGALSGPPLAPGVFNFTITATDGNGGTGSQSYSLTVYPALAITTTGLAVGTANNFYSQQLNAGGGSGGYTFSTTSPLPNGLTLSTAGLLAGTPTDSFGPSNISVTVTDSNGDAQAKGLTLTIDPAITFTTTGIARGVANTGYPSTQLSATGGSGGLAYQASGFLDGLILSSTGLLTGTPLAAGTFAFTVTATDGHGGSGSSAFTLVVNPDGTSLAISAPAITFGANGTVTVTVGSDVGTPGGMVSLSVDGAPALVQTLSGGATTFTLTGLSAATHSLSASYAAQGNYAASANIANLTVNRAGSITALQLPAGTPAASQTVTLTATVSSPAGVPTGSVTFLDGTIPLGTATLSGGTAALTITLTAGNHNFIAAYAGDGNIQGSTSSPQAQAVRTPSQAFVNQVYEDLLHRPADATGLALWGGALDQGILAPWQVAVLIDHSPEARTQLVRQWFHDLLGFAPPAGAEQGWVTLLLEGVSEEQVLSWLLASPTFNTRAQQMFHTGNADQDFIQALYRVLLNVTPSASDVQSWLTVLQGGVSRQAVALAFLDSDAFRTLAITTDYQTFLHRDPDAQGLAFFLSTSELDLGLIRDLIVGSSKA